MDRDINDFYNSFLKEMLGFVGGAVTHSTNLLHQGRHLFGKRFVGVFASDMLPNIKSRQMYIANLDKSDQPGSHWVAVYCKGKELFVYDSFGRSSKKILKSIFRKNKKIVDTEHDAEQNKSEENCGARAMAALYMFDNFDPSLVATYL